MECLGIDPQDGSVYEGRLQIGFRMHPPPMLLPIEFVGRPPISTWSTQQGYAPVIFREDSFDPVTRIRRGRVFALYGNRQPHSLRVQDPFWTDPLAPRRGYPLAPQPNVLLYSRAPLDSLMDTNTRRERLVVTLGSAPFLSLWSVLNVEGSVHGTPVLTLKAQRSFGSIPDLDQGRVPEEIRTTLAEALQKVNDSAHRLGAEAVIDRCRDALSVVFGHACGDRGSDLMRGIDKSRTDQRDRVQHWAGRIVARLHSRAKPNEQEKRDIPPVTEDDAQLALSCLGLVLREQGWARAE